MPRYMLFVVSLLFLFTLVSCTSKSAEDLMQSSLVVITPNAVDRVISTVEVDYSPEILDEDFTSDVSEVNEEEQSETSSYFSDLWEDEEEEGIVNTLLYVTILFDDVPMYAKPDQNSEEILTLEKDERVQVLSEPENGWYTVLKGRRSGYVRDFQVIDTDDRYRLDQEAIKKAQKEILSAMSVVENEDMTNKPDTVDMDVRPAWVFADTMLKSTPDADAIVLMELKEGDEIIFTELVEGTGTAYVLAGKTFGYMSYAYVSFSYIAKQTEPVTTTLPTTEIPTTTTEEIIEITVDYEPYIPSPTEIVVPIITESQTYQQQQTEITLSPTPQTTTIEFIEPTTVVTTEIQETTTESSKINEDEFNLWLYNKMVEASDELRDYILGEIDAPVKYSFSRLPSPLMEYVPLESNSGKVFPLPDFFKALVYYYYSEGTDLLVTPVWDNPNGALNEANLVHWTVLGDVLSVGFYSVKNMPANISYSLALSDGTNLRSITTGVLNVKRYAASVKIPRLLDDLQFGSQYDTLVLTLYDDTNELEVSRKLTVTEYTKWCDNSDELSLEMNQVRDYAGTVIMTDDLIQEIDAYFDELDIIGVKKDGINSFGFPEYVLDVSVAREVTLFDDKYVFSSGKENNVAENRVYRNLDVTLYKMVSVYQIGGEDLELTLFYTAEESEIVVESVRLNGEWLE